MNLINLKRMYNYILFNVPQEKIKMDIFRPVNQNSHECQSTGCVIGHCLILDKWENITFKHGEIDFFQWSEQFTGLIAFSKEWDWCFSSCWPDDKQQILLRLKYLIDNQKAPYYWNNDFDYLLPKLEPYELSKS